MLLFAFAKSRIPLTLQTPIHQLPQSPKHTHFSSLRGDKVAEAIQKKTKKSNHTKPPKILQTPHHAQINFILPRTRHFHATKITKKLPNFSQLIQVFLILKSLKFARKSTFFKGPIYYDPILQGTKTLINHLLSL